MAGKKVRGRPRKQQIRVDDKIPKLNTLERSATKFMESISGTSKVTNIPGASKELGSVLSTQIYRGEASGSARQQQKQANQSPIPMHVDLRGSITPLAIREITVPLSKEQDHAAKTLVGNTVPLMNKELKQATSKESTWANVLTGNRSAANGMTLTYITPEIVEGNLVAKLEKSEIEQENLKWKNALIVYVLGEKLGYNSMKRYINQIRNRKPPAVKQIWRTKEPAQVTINEGEQKQDVVISKEVLSVPKPSENKETHKDGETIEASRQLDKGKMKADDNQMTYAKAIMSPVKQRAQASQCTAVIAIQKPPDIEHPRFMTLVEEVWKEQQEHDPMRNIWQKLKRLKPLLKQLNNSEFRGITERLESTRSMLKDIQTQMSRGYSDKLATEEKQALEYLERWSLIEESILQQKARATWLRLGDANSKYFSAVIKGKKTKESDHRVAR
ncbi:hypothetical protein A4A49_59297 [Nicotiana attenuata]|uniref:Uncharacterized protein n=1 Tax=Nicotiana attenuata TaxID=49451 RepID=A0A314LDV2_NICAT|nr:hypothetical protein A4A49_59297 [Nicotiana attenuata]